MAGEPAATKLIRVLIVAASRAQASAVARLIRLSRDIVVQKSVHSANEALAFLVKERPDLVLLLGTKMEGGDSLGLVNSIMAQYPAPILVIAEPGHEDSLAQRLLSAGALDVWPWPAIFHGTEVAAALAARIRVLARVAVVTRRREHIAKVRANCSPGRDNCQPRVVAMVASTGGPSALARILRPLPADYPVPVVVVQHIATGFAAGLARWLNSSCALPVYLVEQEMPLLPPGVFLAPDDRHLQLTATFRLRLDDYAPVHNLRPRGDVLLRSVAQTCGPRAVGIVLTGMGDDGVVGLAEMRRRGALTIAQSQEGCVVYGMPRVALEHGAAISSLSLDEITELLLALPERGAVWPN